MDIEGDLARLFRIGFETGFDSSTGPLVNIRNRWHEWRFSNATVEQARDNARAHYGLGTDFYQYWLDKPAMMYTCAYWKTAETLEEAQQIKNSEIAEELALPPVKVHCSVLAEDAIKAAIKDFSEKKAE